MQNEFDYLIVGGGTAGCVLASELTERQAGSVAVIEAGKRPLGKRVFTPAAIPKTFGSRWDYQLTTIPQAGLRGRSIRWPRVGCLAFVRHKRHDLHPRESARL